MRRKERAALRVHVRDTFDVMEGSEMKKAGFVSLTLALSVNVSFAGSVEEAV